MKFLWQRYVLLEFLASTKGQSSTKTTCGLMDALPGIKPFFPVKAADLTVSRVQQVGADEGRVFCPGANMRRPVRYPYDDRLGHLG